VDLPRITMVRFREHEHDRFRGFRPRNHLGTNSEFHLHRARAGNGSRGTGGAVGRVHCEAVLDVAEEVPGWVCGGEVVGGA